MPIPSQFSFLHSGEKIFIGPNGLSDSVWGQLGDGKIKISNGTFQCHLFYDSNVCVLCGPGGGPDEAAAEQLE